MPKVLLPTIDAPPSRGGVARYIGAIAATFPAQVTVAELRLPTSYWQIFWLLWGRAHEHDTLWIHHVLPIGTVAYVCRLLRSRPYVIFLHGLDFDLARRNAWKRWLTRRVLQKAKHVVANSRALAREVAAFAGIAEPLVVYPCVADKFVEIADEKLTNTTPHAASNGLRVLTVARLVERKGHLKVLAAMKDVPGMTYHIVGDGPCEATIRQRITQLGLHDRVTLDVGMSDRELPSAYAAADVFVMPATKSATDREGFGTVYLEANLFGLPVIATRSPGVDEAVVDVETGLLIDDTVEALRGALLRVMSDRTLRATLGQQGRARVLADFTREKQFATLRNLL